MVHMESKRVTLIYEKRDCTSAEAKCGRVLMISRRIGTASPS